MNSRRTRNMYGQIAEASGGTRMHASAPSPSYSIPCACATYTHPPGLHNPVWPRHEDTSGRMGGTRGSNWDSRLRKSRVRLARGCLKAFPYLSPFRSSNNPPVLPSALRHQRRTTSTHIHPRCKIFLYMKNNSLARSILTIRRWGATRDLAAAAEKACKEGLLLRAPPRPRPRP